MSMDCGPSSLVVDIHVAAKPAMTRLRFPRATALFDDLVNVSQRLTLYYCVPMGQSKWHGV